VNPLPKREEQAVPAGQGHQQNPKPADASDLTADQLNDVTGGASDLHIVKTVDKSSPKL
jgi:hypothetical protein